MRVALLPAALCPLPSVLHPPPSDPNSRRRLNPQGIASLSPALDCRGATGRQSYAGKTPENDHQSGCINLPCLLSRPPKIGVRGSSFRVRVSHPPPPFSILFGQPLAPRRYSVFFFVPEPSWNTLRSGSAAHPYFRAMPATAATLVGRKKRMRICLQARSTR
jgi:hypothetical protein